MFSEVGNAPARSLALEKVKKPILKGAFVEESIYLGDDLLDTLVDIKSRGANWRSYNTSGLN